MQGTSILLICFIINIIFKTDITTSLYNSLVIAWIYSCVNLLLLNNIISLIIILTISLIIIIINKVKKSVLKENFHYEDLFLYSQVFKFPKFYIPFIGKFKFTLVFTSIFCIILSIIYLHVKSYYYLNIELFLQSLADFVIFNILIILLYKYFQNKKYDKKEALNTGLFGSIIYFSSKSIDKNIKYNSRQILNINDNEFPDKIIAVQSESFIITNEKFDYPLDKTLYGKLNVPCFGAYTMRSEFSFLTGVSSDSLQANYCNPYRKIYKFVSNSYVKQLKDLGYKCIAIHPFKKTFFSRDLILKHFGFDEFIDESFFEKKDIFIPDELISIYLKNLFKNNKNQKVFIFIITIAGHGPYTLNRKDPKQYISKTHNKEIQTYLDVNYKATKMLNFIINLLQKKDLLIWYGDHKPSIKRWKEVDKNYFQTNYIIYNKNNNLSKEQKTLNIEDLLFEGLNYYKNNK